MDDCARVNSVRIDKKGHMKIAFDMLLDVSNIPRLCGPTHGFLMRLTATIQSEALNLAMSCFNASPEGT